ncbi:MAG: acetyl-CoA carboxylase biotin carboxyl carrier protein subunit [Bacteroidales bacterium]|nr:acetyl-CoA carboxylase biotin carboxyl carrier protein subunit [Bacteroidales bacterium]
MENKDFKMLNIDGTKYKTLIPEKYENRKVWEQPDKRILKSFIPGTILKLFVTEGQKVKEGQRILILEAMKVQNRILAPITGTVKSINVEVGEKIPKNKLLIEFE